MPRYEGQEYEAHKLHEDVPDDALVYYNASTGEAFESYEEYIERQTLYSSGVWTCDVTGRTGLTLFEAIASESEAASMLATICPALQRAILYIAHTQSPKLGSMDLVSALLQYINNRFFIGEEVVVLEKHARRHGTVLNVIPPSDDEISDSVSAATTDGFKSVQFGIDSTIYKYAVQLKSEQPKKECDSQDSEGTVMETKEVDSTHIKRPNESINKEKLRLFIKTCGTGCRKGRVHIPPQIIEQFHLNELTWTDVYDGPLPDFTEPTKSVRHHPKAKVTLLSISQTHSTSNAAVIAKISEPKPPAPAKMTPEEREKLRIEARDRRNELKRLARLKAREEKAAKQAVENAWKRKRDDLVCDDLVPLPAATPVKSRIPESLFGDALAIMEFLNLYNALLELKEFFPHGITLPILEEILFSRSISGPFSDVVKVLLATNLALIDEDEKYYLANPTSLAGSAPMDSNLLENVADDDDNEDRHEGVENARKTWATIKETFGVTIKDLVIDDYTLTEIARLHLLTSGAWPRQRCVQRAWFDPWEDPLLSLRSSRSDLLDDLERHTLYGLAVEQRVSLLTGFINQMLTFIMTRDNIEVSFQELQSLKKEIREKIFAAKKIANQSQPPSHSNSMGPDSKGDDQDSKPDDSQTHISANISEPIDRETYAKLRQLQATYNGKPVGRDRAYRRYFLLYSLGVLLTDHSDVVGVCLDPNDEDVIGCKKRQEGQGDEEGAHPHPLLGPYDKCTLDPSTCLVHGEIGRKDVAKWSFYHTEQQIEDLISALNARGIRESATRDYLTTHRLDIVEKLKNFSSLHLLNPALANSHPSEMQNGHHEDETPIDELLKIELRKRIKEQIVLGNDVSATEQSASDFVDLILAVASTSSVTDPLASHMGRWEDSLKKCSNTSALLLHYSSLERAISVPERRPGRKRKIDLENSALLAKRSIPSSIDFRLFDEIIKSLARSDFSWPFRKRPTEKTAPNYFKCVKKYVDLPTLVGRLNDGTYRTNADAFRDILLMFTNCELYWPLDHDIAVAGRKLNALFDCICAEKNLDPLA